MGRAACGLGGSTGKAEGFRVDSFASFFFHESFFSRGSRIRIGFSSLRLGEGGLRVVPLEREGMNEEWDDGVETGGGSESLTSSGGRIRS